MRRSRLVLALGLAVAAGVSTLGVVSAHREDRSAVASRHVASGPTDADARAPGPTVAPPMLAAPLPRPVDRGPTTCAIVGIVRRAGKPIAAAVEIRAAAPLDDTRTDELAPPHEATVLARTTSGADGRFTVASLPAGRHLVRAATEDGARGVTVVTIDAAGARVEVVVELLAATRSLRGVVTFDDGRPYRGEVYVVPRPTTDRPFAFRIGSRRREPLDDGADVRTVTTNERGEFEAHGLTTGRYGCVVLLGPMRVGRAAWAPSEEPLAITLPSQIDGVRGTVVAESTGAPVGGATVSWWGRAGAGDGTRRTLRVVTDAEGRFAIPDASEFSVSAPGFVDFFGRSDGGKTPSTHVALVRTATIRGRATSAADGRPVEGVVVEAWESPWQRESDLGTTTDAQGRYELTGLSPGEVSLRFRGAQGLARGMADLSPDDGGSAPLENDPFVVRVAAGGEATLDVAIEPAARIVGRVTDASGAAAAGVVVWAECPFTHYNTGWRPHRFWETGRAVTDADGRYAIDGLLPRRYYEVSAGRGAEAASGSVVASVGVDVARCDLRFRSLASFDVRVVDVATGEGVECVGLRAWPESPGASTWVGASGEAGLARVGPMEAGVITLRVEDNREWDSEAEVVVTARTERTDPPMATLRVRRTSSSERLSSAPARASEAPTRPPATKALRVHVLDSSRHLVPRAQVTWRRTLEGGGSNSGSTSVEAGLATIERPTAAGGPTSITVARARGADDASLHLTRADAGPIADDVNEVEVRLEEARVVTGRVLDPDGRGLAGLRVRLVTPGDDAPVVVGDEPVDRTDADGRFSIDDDTRGRGERLLVLNVPERFADVWPADVGDSWLADVGRGRPIEIRLHATVDATVTITGRDGRGAAGLEVRAMPLGDDRPRGISNLIWSPRWGRAETDADGVARLSDLDPNRRYKLFVKGKRDGEPERESAVDDWDPKDTKLVWGGTRTIHGIVRDPDGKPLASAHVVAFVGHTWAASATTAADGTFDVVSGGVGKLRLYATMAGWGRGVCSEVVDAPDGDVPVTITLDAGLELRFRLDGETIAKRTILLMADPAAGWQAESDYQMATTDETGFVRVRGLREDVVYAAWVAPSSAGGIDVAGGDATTAFVGGLKASPSASKSAIVTMRLGAGGTIRVHPKDGMSWRHASMIAKHGRMQITGAALADGTIEFTTLCDLDWTIEVEEWGGGRRAEAKGRPGAELPLEWATVPTK